MICKSTQCLLNKACSDNNGHFGCRPNDIFHVSYLSRACFKNELSHIVRNKEEKKIMAINNRMRMEFNLNYNKKKRREKNPFRIIARIVVNVRCERVRGMDGT